MSRIIQGLMRSTSLSDEELYELIKYDLDSGITIFDLADIYGNGEVELKLGRILKEHKELRDKMFIQTKCSIVLGDTYYDLSYDHIIESVKLSLSRLNIEYLDSLLLHRPDILMDKDEIKRAFDYLKQNGLVKHFGVSNFSKEVIKYLDMDNYIEYNQIQLGLGQMRLIEEVLNFNMNNDEGSSHTNDTLFYLKKKGIKIQAWSPLIAGYFEGSIFDNNKYLELNRKLDELAYKYNVSKSSIAINFLLMLDKDLNVIIGSMNMEHIKEALDAEAFKLSKEDWYSLYKSTGKMLP